MDVQALFVRDDKTSPSEALALLKFRLQALALYRGIASDVKSQESGSVKLRCRRFVPVVPISSAGQSLLVLGETAEGSSVTRAKPWLLLSPDQRPLQAEAFEDLLAKLKNLWAPRQTVFIEVRLLYKSMHTHGCYAMIYMYCAKLS